MAARIFTAIIGIPLGIGLLYYGEIALLLAVLLLAIRGLWEFNQILSKIQMGTYPVVSYPSLALLLYGFHTQNWLLILGVMTLMVLSASILLIYRYPKDELTALAGTILAVIYSGWIFGFILSIRALDSGFYLVVFLLVIIWGTDSGAYFVGTYLGKHKLIPRLSPKKSKEGFVGGLFAALILALGFGIWLGMPLFFIILIAPLLSILAQLGDLIESCFKRISGIKDSGALLPGHGGVLDRFDSFFLAAPAFYFILEWSVNII